MSYSYGGSGYHSRDGLASRQNMFGGRPGGGADNVQIHIDPSSGFDFDREVDGLRAQVGKIKELTKAIDEERKQQGELIQSLEAAMEAAQAALSRTMKRMKVTMKHMSSNHLLYLIFFALLLFFGVYVLAKMYRTARMFA